MQKLLFSLLITCLFWTSCERTEDPVLTGFDAPVFRVGFSTDTIAADSVIAGLNNVYHFTSYTESGGIFRSINTFADASCPEGDCPGSLRFEFTGNAGLDTLFNLGSFRYEVPDSLPDSQTTYYTTFNWGDIFFQFQEHTFTVFGSGPDPIVLTTPQSAVTLFDTIGAPMDIWLVSLGANGMVSTIERTVSRTEPNTFPSVSIKAIPENSGYNLTAFNDWTGSDIIDYQWNTGDSSNTIFVDSLGQFQEYFVTVSDLQGQTAVASLSLLPFPAQTEIRNAQITVDRQQITNTDDYGTVAIQWVDASGTIWRSDRKTQLQDVFFQVLDSEAYEPNEIGNSTLKLHINFQCLLYNVQGESKPFSGTGVIALAYP